MLKIVPILAALLSLLMAALSDGALADEIPIKKRMGTFSVPVELNGKITLDFIVDSGAADVTIPEDVLRTLKRTGTVTGADYLGMKTYVLANGQEETGPVYLMRSMKVGNHIIERVRIGVTQSDGDPLLGQSFLNRFGSWAINNTRQMLILDPQSKDVDIVVEHGRETTTKSQTMAPPSPPPQATPKTPKPTASDTYRARAIAELTAFERGMPETVMQERFCKDGAYNRYVRWDGRHESAVQQISNMHDRLCVGVRASVQD